MSLITFATVVKSKKAMVLTFIIKIVFVFITICCFRDPILNISFIYICNNNLFCHLSCHSRGPINTGHYLSTLQSFNICGFSILSQFIWTFCLVVFHLKWWIIDMGFYGPFVRCPGRADVNIWILSSCKTF